MLSGPAGGVVGYAQTSYHQPSNPFHNTPVIGFDMGGTSTDVSRYDGRYEHVFESTTAGVIIQAPQVYLWYINYICFKWGVGEFKNLKWLPILSSFY